MRENHRRLRPKKLIINQRRFTRQTGRVPDTAVSAVPGISGCGGRHPGNRLKSKARAPGKAPEAFVLQPQHRQPRPEKVWAALLPHPVFQRVLFAIPDAGQKADDNVAERHAQLLFKDTFESAQTGLVPPANEPIPINIELLWERRLPRPQAVEDLDVVVPVSFCAASRVANSHGLVGESFHGLQAFHNRGCLHELLPLPIEARLLFTDFGQAPPLPLRLLLGLLREGLAQGQLS